MTPLATTWSTFEPIANHLWQSTIVLAVCAALAFLLRHKRADVRHWIWLLASLKFMLPFALLTYLGGLLPTGAGLVPVLAAPPAAAMVQPFSQVFRLTSPSSVQATASAVSLVPTALAILWALGVVAVCAIWVVRWRRLLAAAASAAPLVDGREVTLLRAIETRAGSRRSLPMRLAEGTLEPGVFGVFRSLLLWPRGISERLDDEQIKAVLAHELSHVRRRDNLKALLHMLVQAVFWFHPLVWWLGARLMDERERACDEAVLDYGSDPEVYARGILKTCEFFVESPLPCVAGVTGADLRRRIVQIMDGRTAGLLALRTKLLLVAIACLAVIVPVVAGSAARTHQAPDSGERALHRYSLRDTLRRLAAPLLPSYKVDRLFANGNNPDAPGAAAAQDSASAVFDVASVKPSSGGGDDRFQMLPNGHFAATNITVRRLILRAYSLQEYQLIEAPDWTATESFDIEATGSLTPGSDRQQQFMSKIRTLLRDRFKLALRQDRQDQKLYSLEFVRNDKRLGKQLKPAPTDCDAYWEAQALAREAQAPGTAPGPSGPHCGVRFRFGGAAVTLDLGAMTMSQLAELLSTQVKRAVLDGTGLAGRFDLELEFKPDPLLGLPQPPGGAAAPAFEAPTLPVALEEQAGLTLKSGQGPVPVWVVEHVERPSPN